MKKTLLPLSVSLKAVTFTRKLFLLVFAFVFCFSGYSHAGSKPGDRKVHIGKANGVAGKSFSASRVTTKKDATFFSDGAIGANYNFSCYPQGAATPLNTTAGAAATTAPYTFLSTDCNGFGFTATSMAASNASLNIVPNSIVGTYIRAIKSNGGNASLDLKSTSLAEFKLTNLGVVPVNANVTQTFTVQGYKDGSAVSAAVVTSTYTVTPQVHKTTFTSTNFGSNFDNIDEVRISTSIAFGVGGTDIQTTSPVIPVTLNSLTRVTTTPTNSSSVQYTASFSGSITGLTTSNFSTTGSTVSGCSVTGLSGSGSSYTVTVSTGTGDGNLQLNLANSTGITGGSITNSLPYAGQVYAIDKTAPAAPSTPDMATASDAGASNSDNVTNVTTPTFTGTAESGATVNLYDTNGTTVLGTATATGGNWSITSSTLSSGSHTLTAKATDAVGNTGTASSGLGVTIDTTSPTLAITSNVAALKIGQTATITFTFSEDPGSTFTWNGSSGDVSVSGGTLGAISGSGLTRTATFTPTANTNGGTVSITVAAGSYQDLAGNNGGAGSSPTINFDTLSPNAPSTPDLAAASDAGASNSDNVTNITTPTFTGTAESGATVTLYDTNGTTVLGTATATGGNWSITSSTLAAGSHTLTAKATDAAGNVSTASSGLGITIDTTAPTLAITSNTAALKAGETATITFTFSEDPGSTFTWDGSTGDVSVSGGTLGAISGSGLTRTATFTPPANTNSGTVSITVAAGSYQDLAGNNGGAGSSPTINFDTLSPNALSTPDLAAASDAGASNSDDITNITTPTFTGTAESNATVTLYDTDGTTVLGSAIATGGNWSITSSTLAPGGHNITANSTDVAGNVGTASSGLGITIDTSAPTVLSIAQQDGANPLTLNGGQLDYTVTFSEPVTGVDATDFVATTTGGVSQGTMSASPTSSTTYNVSITNVTGDGSYRLDLKSSGTGITDVAGNNQAGFTSGDVITIDNTAPTVTSITRVGTTPTNATSVDYTVTFSEPVSGVDKTDFTATAVSGTVSGTVSAISGSGATYTVTVNNITGDGDLRLDLNNSSTGIIDIASNPISGGFTTGQTYTFDNTAPNANTALVFASNHSGNQLIAAVGDVVSLSFTTSEAIQAPTVSIAGHSLTATNTSGNDWVASYAMTSGDTEGRIPFSLQFNDIVGNAGVLYNDIGAGDDIEFDESAPTIMIGAPSQASIGTGTAGTVTYTVTYADANFNANTLGTGDITLNTTGASTATVAVSNAGTTSTVTLSNITGVGTLGISIGAGTASDAAGNLAPAAGPATTFSVFSSDASLSSLTTSVDPLSPAFDTNTTTGYTASVPNSVATMTVTPTTTDTNTSDLEVRVNGGAPVFVASGSQSAALALNEGTNTIDVQVTAQDGTTTKTYTLKVTRRAPAQLFSFVFNPGITLHAVAGPQYKNYTGMVDNSVSSVTVTPKVKEVAAIIMVNNVTVASGATSGSIHLDEGENTITTVVTEGSINKTYSFVITRLPIASLLSISVSPKTALKEVAGSNYKDYTANVVNSVSSVTVTPVAPEMVSVITVNNVQVTSGTASSAINLNEGVNTITTVVTNGAFSHTYSIRITRQPPAQLFSLVFNPGITVHTVPGPDYRNYAGTVDNSLTSVTATPKALDPAAIITINNVAVTSGTASGTINLNEGDNTITTIVTQDLTSHTYTFVITRTPSPPVTYFYASKEAPITSTDIIVHQNVSPNGDGRSDGLVIEGIAAHPNNKLQIMNRSGALVYEAKGYDNATKVFDGHASNGKLQQAGTYFYSLEYKDGNETKHKTGFIVLKY